MKRRRRKRRTGFARTTEKGNNSKSERRPFAGHGNNNKTDNVRIT
jgi:hypothetical protein